MTQESGAADCPRHFPVPQDRRYRDPSAPKAWQICEYINMPLDIEGSQMFAVTTMGL